jgi:hypothetical protein
LRTDWRRLQILDQRSGILGHLQLEINARLRRLIFYDSDVQNVAAALGDHARNLVQDSGPEPATTSSPNLNANLLDLVFSENFGPLTLRAQQHFADSRATAPEPPATAVT